MSSRPRWPRREKRAAVSPAGGEAAHLHNASLTLHQRAVTTEHDPRISGRPAEQPNGNAESRTYSQYAPVALRRRHQGGRATGCVGISLVVATSYQPHLDRTRSDRWEELDDWIRRGNMVGLCILG